MPSLSSRRV